MARFMFMFRGPGMTGLAAADQAAQLQHWNTWLGELAASKRMDPGGQRLLPGGRTLAGKQRTVIDGPYAESKDLVTGVIIIHAATLDEAGDVALGCPIFEQDGSVEVRPILEREM
jgi:hypothetical protein